MNIIKVKYFAYLFLFFCFSCINNKNNSDNNFLAYYNTFYSAEISFDKAIDIIESNPDIEQIPLAAIQLLDSAIKNSNIIIENYYNTEYVDDAYYIIGRASFYKDRVSVSSYYFNKIIDDFVSSEFFYESHIWLGFIYVDLNEIEKLSALLDKLKANIDQLNDNMYLYHMLLAQIDLNNNMLFEAENNFLLALDQIQDNLTKKNIFLNLLKISELQLDYEKSLEYIYGANLYSDEALSLDLLDKWYEYSRKIKEYDSIYLQIDDLIKNGQLTNKERLYHLRQKILTLIIENKYLEAEDVAKNLIDEFKDNRIYKSELSELYYYLGLIELNNNANFLDAKQYFIESSKATTSGVNEFKIKSKEISDAITLYLNFQEELIYLKENEGDFKTDFDEEENPFNIPISKENLSNNEGLDSLLYLMGEILYFDLNQLDSSKVKFIKIIEEYPESQFAAKSLFVLSQIDQTEDWSILLSQSFPNSIYLNLNINKSTDELDSLRNNAWQSLPYSKEASLTEFLNIYNEHNDPLSLYITAFIYDYYVKDIFNAVEYYEQFLKNYPEHRLFINAKIRLDEIEGNLDFEIDASNQKISCCNGLNLMQSKDFNIDSLNSIFLNISSGTIPKINLYSSKVLNSINKYNEYYRKYVLYDSVKIDDSLISSIKLDSVIHNLSKIMLMDFNNYELAKYYADILIDKYPESDFIPEAHFISNYIRKENSLDTLEYISDVDSNLVSEIINFKKEINQLNKFLINCDLNKLSIELDRYINMNMKLYPEIQINMENNIDSINIPIDTIRLNTKN